jgi:hypothetical protein
MKLGRDLSPKTLGIFRSTLRNGIVNFEALNVGTLRKLGIRGKHPLLFKQVYDVCVSHVA